MHQGCDGSFGGGEQVVDKLRKMGFSGMVMPVEVQLVCEGCGAAFQMKTLEDRCSQCGMVYGVTPCHAADPSSVKAAGVGY
jgi:rRNA maturation endonuclease Nob1